MSVPSRGEIFGKMTDLMDQIISCAATMAHLHQTEGSDKDKKLAVGWLMMSELFKKLRHKIILLGQGRMN
jgi:hypothetical protein